jgi:hypothetical protein
VLFPLLVVVLEVLMEDTLAAAEAAEVIPIPKHL